MIAGWLGVMLAFAPPTPVAQSLSHCDRVALEGRPAERDYQCYAAVARDGESETVLAHLAELVVLHPDDGRLWLTYGSMQGDFGEDSTDALRTAITTLAAQGLPQYQIQAQLNLSRQLSFNGDADTAWQILEQAQVVADALKHPLLSAIVDFDRLGQVANRLDGDLLTAYERAAVSYAALPKSAPYQVRRNGLQLMARAARALGRTRTAARLATEAAETAEEAGDAHSALHARRMVARNQLRAAIRGNDPDAIPDFRRRLETLLARAIELDNPLAELSTRTGLAYTAPLVEQPALWIACHELAVKLQTELGAASCLAGLAGAVMADEPERAAVIADDLVGTARASGSVRELADALRVQGRVAASRGDLDAAWVAWSSMFDAFEKISRTPDDAELRTLLHAGGADRYRLVSGTLLRQAANHNKILARAFEAMERMRGREALEFRRRSSVPQTPASSIVALDELIRSVPGDTAIVMFQVGEDFDVAGHQHGGSWVMVVTGDGARAYALPDARIVNPAVAMVADGLAGPPSDAVRVGSAALHKMLLEPALAGLSAAVRRLVVVPDGLLHRLPFGALMHDGELLVQRFAISTVPSASLWARLRDTDPLPRRLVAFADPTPLTHDDRFRLHNAPARLAGAVAESRVAAELIGGSSYVLTGDEATESALKTTSGASIVHIAAHAVVDHTRPRDTRVLLASDGVEDGRVYLDELSQLQPRGGLVVLAACQGADGELLAGEGALSPARALFLAGARTVVAGMWPVDDAEAAAFFVEFYTALDDGQAVDAAVAFAQLQRRDAGAPASSWAGFVVLGDGSVTIESRRGPRRWHWIVLAAMVGALVGGVGVPLSRGRR